MAVAVTIGTRRTQTLAKPVSAAVLRCPLVPQWLSITQELSQVVAVVAVVVALVLQPDTLALLAAVVAAELVSPTHLVESGEPWPGLLADQQVLRVHHLVLVAVVAAAHLATVKMEIYQPVDLEGLVVDGVQAEIVDPRAHPLTTVVQAAVQAQQYQATATLHGWQQEHV